MNQFKIAVFGSALLMSGGGFAVAQTTPAPAADYSTLTARSAALAPAEKTRAQQLFATGFSLWQSGDFAAAELAFKRGLDIDPANALANYYYGDCLVRRKDKAEARDYLARAAALGNGSAEGFKAEAELTALSTAPSNVADMNPQELDAAFSGQWRLQVRDHSGPMILQSQGNGVMTVSGGFPTWGGGDFKLDSASSSDNHITVVSKVALFRAGFVMTGRLVTPTRMEGILEWRGVSSASVPWSAAKQ